MMDDTGTDPVQNQALLGALDAMVQNGVLQAPGSIDANPYLAAAYQSGNQNEINRAQSLAQSALYGGIPVNDGYIDGGGPTPAQLNAMVQMGTNATLTPEQKNLMALQSRLTLLQPQDAGGGGFVNAGNGLIAPMATATYAGQAEQSPGGMFYPPPPDAQRIGSGAPLGFVGRIGAPEDASPSQMYWEMPYWAWWPTGGAGPNSGAKNSMELPAAQKINQAHNRFLYGLLTGSIPISAAYDPNQIPGGYGNEAEGQDYSTLNPARTILGF
jgi:hypothetical protein